MWSFLLAVATSFCTGVLAERYWDISFAALAALAIGGWLCCTALVLSLVAMSDDGETVVAPCWFCGATLEEGDEECWKCGADQAVPHE